jgi:hypothetical protein
MKTIRFITTAALCCASVLAMSMALAASASAVHWLECQKGASGTKYTSSQCVTASSSGEWAWSTIPSGATETVRLRGTLRFYDTKRELELQCAFEWSGLISSKATGEITSLGHPTCEGIKVCELESDTEFFHLPWTTELTETESKTLVLLKGGTGGEPGWKFKCRIDDIPEDDECNQEEKKPESLLGENKNTAGELLVLATFQTLRKWNCTKGGAESGKWEGSLAILKVNGAALRLSLK